MKNTLLDITQKISRTPKPVKLVVENLSHPTYWIWKATGWKFNELRREIQYRNDADRLMVWVNTVRISDRDFIYEEVDDGILVKFIKSQFIGYVLDSEDYIEIKGDIYQQYA